MSDQCEESGMLPYSVHFVKEISTFTLFSHSPHTPLTLPSHFPHTSLYHCRPAAWSPHCPSHTMVWRNGGLGMESR